MIYTHFAPGWMIFVVLGSICAAAVLLVFAIGRMAGKRRPR